MVEMTRLEALRAIERLRIDGDKQPGKRVVYRDPDPIKLRGRSAETPRARGVKAPMEWGFLRAIR